MTLDELVVALALPGSCRVDQRVPKKLLIENGAPTAADKRLISDAIAEIQWLAALKPTTVGVPEYRDEQREYLEIAVLSVTLRGSVELGDPAQAQPVAHRPVNTLRLAELVHRAVPYPVLLLLQTPSGLALSLAHKRWAQNEGDKMVLDGDIVSVELGSDLTADHPFAQAMALHRQPQANLLAVYGGWVATIQALQAARHTGSFKLALTPEQVEARRRALQDCQRLELEAVRLRAQAEKEKQMARQVDLNLALQRVLADLAAARAAL